MRRQDRRAVQNEHTHGFRGLDIADHGRFQHIADTIQVAKQIFQRCRILFYSLGPFERCQSSRNKTGSPYVDRIGFQLIETVAKLLDDRQHGMDASAVEQLLRVIAFVEQFLAAVALVADVDVITSGQGDERTPICGRSTLVRIARIRDG